MERPLDAFERRALIVELLVNTFVSVPPDKVRSIAEAAFGWTYLSDAWLLKELAKDEGQIDG